MLRVAGVDPALAVVDPQGRWEVVEGHEEDWIADEEEYLPGED
jgi:hypothetical protein